MEHTSTEARRRPGGDALLAALAAAAILALLLVAPGGPLDKADAAAYAVCHRIPERTFFFAGRPLPLCARCSGTYLGTLAGLIVLAMRGRGRAMRLPALRHGVVLGGFVLLWAADGLNSYLTFFPGLPHLYEPNNLLRLITGTLQGLALAAFLLPMLNLSLWATRAAAEGASVSGWRDLAALLAGGAVVVLLVSSEWPALLYPLALLSGVLVVTLIGCVNVMLLLIVLRREGQARRLRQVAAPLLAGLALALAELTAIGLARAALTARLGLPF